MERITQGYNTTKPRTQVAIFTHDVIVKVICPQHGWSTHTRAKPTNVNEFKQWALAQHSAC